MLYSLLLSFYLLYCKQTFGSIFEPCNSIHTESKIIKYNLGRYNFNDTINTQDQVPRNPPGYKRWKMPFATFALSLKQYMADSGNVDVFMWLVILYWVLGNWVIG